MFSHPRGRACSRSRGNAPEWLIVVLGWRCRGSLVSVLVSIVSQVEWKPEHTLFNVCGLNYISGHEFKRPVSSQRGFISTRDTGLLAVTLQREFCAAGAGQRFSCFEPTDWAVDTAANCACDPNTATPWDRRSRASQAPRVAGRAGGRGCQPRLSWSFSQGLVPLSVVLRALLIRSLAHWKVWLFVFSLLGCGRPLCVQIHGPSQIRDSALLSKSCS